MKLLKIEDRVLNNKGPACSGIHFIKDEAQRFHQSAIRNLKSQMTTFRHSSFGICHSSFFIRHS